MTMLPDVKRFTAELKDATTSADGKNGLATMAVSVFGNIDHCGDRVMPGAFTKDIAEWAASGRPQPVVWSHDWDDPKSIVGETVERSEQPFGDGKSGLIVKQQYDITKPPEMSHASQVFDLVSRRLIYQASYAYRIVTFELVDPAPGETTPRADGKVRNLIELKTFENGPTLLGMNDQTDVLEAASRAIDGLKVGRTLSSTNEGKLTAAHDLIGEVLSTVADTDGGTEMASRDTEVKALDFDGSLVEDDAARDASFSRLWQLEYAFEDTIWDIACDESGADPAALLDAAVDQYATSLKAWGRLFLGVVAADDIGDEVEEVDGEMVDMASLRTASVKARQARAVAFHAAARKSAADTGATMETGRMVALIARTRHEEE
jgi:HK97 family phage prohead protease